MFEFQPSYVARTITLDGLLSRPVSVLAVLSVMCAVAGVGAFIHPFACAASVCSLSFGLFAFLQVRRYEYSRSSRVLIAGGLSIAMLTLVSAPTWHLQMYRSEALPGHLRVTFAELFSRVSAAPRSNDWIADYAPEKVQESRVASGDRGAGLNGQRICLKGYVYPTDEIVGLTEFLLTPDGSGQDEQYVGVILAAGTTWDWARGGVAVSGLLELNPAYTPGSDLDVRYILKDASVRPACTLYGMKNRRRAGGC